MSPRIFSRVITGLNIVVIAFAITHGLLRTGNPSRYFGEGRYTTFLSAAQLLGIGLLSWRIFRLRVVNSSKKFSDTTESDTAGGRWIWLLMAAGFLFLAIDEVAQLHERMDRGIIRFFNLPRTPLTDRIDDAILAAYGLAGLALMWCCRRELLNFRRAMLGPMLAGFAAMFVGILCDTAANDNHYLFRLTGDLAAAQALNGWFSALEGAFTLLPEAMFLTAFHAAWRQALPVLPMPMAEPADGIPEEMEAGERS
ncbi:MAG: hypothetical protein JWL81_2547 [Verrucomicrobiales bacterium]|nr:hypothetical protein [Verrucomicrobiales bacterium]